MSHDGNGSTLVMFELYLDNDSNLDLVRSPMSFRESVSEAIDECGMHERCYALDDKFPLEQMGEEMVQPATGFHSLSESHVHYSILQFVRTETWPAQRYIQGEAQLCNYSRDNTLATQELVANIVRRINPAKAHFMLIVRGPGRRPHVLGVVDWKRGNLLFPFPQEVASHRKAAEAASRTVAE